MENLVQVQNMQYTKKLITLEIHIEVSAEIQGKLQVH